MALEVGSKAPAFKAQDEQGNWHKLADYKGKKLAFYFYPKDDTPGCTAQACSLKDDYSALQKAGIEILGVSIDSAAKHIKFKEKYQLPFPLLVDEDKTLVQQFDVWGEKKFMGKTYEGTHRVTFLIDEKGVIAHVIDKVKTKDHAQQILSVWGL